MFRMVLLAEQGAPTLASIRHVDTHISGKILSCRLHSILSANCRKKLWLSPNGSLPGKSKAKAVQRKV
jgi:hypothetical protein